MNTPPAEAVILTEFPEELRRQVAGLFREAGWLMPAEDAGYLAAALPGAAAAAGIFADGELAAFGMALSDGVSEAYLQNIVVGRRWRRRGFGGAVVRKLTEELRRRGVDWIGLVGEPGTENFYRSLGWKAETQYTFWRAPEEES